MASMMGGDFVEAYVLKNAYKEKIRRLEADEEEKKKKTNQGSAEKKAVSGSGGSRGGGGGLFGLIKKKVHPKAGASSAATETCHGDYSS